jgi:hypothetical protein
MGAPRYLFYAQQRGNLFVGESASQTSFVPLNHKNFFHGAFKQRYSSYMTTKEACQRWQRRLCGAAIMGKSC